MGHLRQHRPGSPLGRSSMQRSSVPGTFIYTPAAGFLMNAAAGQILSVTFTPTDSADYTSVTATTTINVQQALPTITWPTAPTLTTACP